MKSDISSEQIRKVILQKKDMKIRVYGYNGYFSYLKGKNIENFH